MEHVVTQLNAAISQHNTIIGKKRSYASAKND